MRKDLIVGIVGTLVLVGGLFGIIQLEASRPAGDAYRVTWEEVVAALPTSEGTTTEARPETPQDVVVAARNVTRAVFRLAWTDDAPNSQPDAFELKVTSPNGVTRTAEGREGSVEVAFEGLALTPSEVSRLGASPAEVEARLDAEYGNATGTGTWKVVVRLIDAGDQLAPAGGVAIVADAGNPWELGGSVTVYRPIIERETE